MNRSELKTSSNPQMVDEALAWIDATEGASDEDVRSRIRQWVPEYHSCRFSPVLGPMKYMSASCCYCYLTLLDDMELHRCML